MTQRTDTIELAYGLLWTLEIDTTTAEGAQLSKARRNLLVLLDKQGQSRGITAARTALANSHPPRWMDKHDFVPAVGNGSIGQFCAVCGYGRDEPHQHPKNTAQPSPSVAVNDDQGGVA